MKSVARVLLLGAVAVFAIAISVAPSEAQKKKKATSTCQAWSWCSKDCQNNTCRVYSCEGGKWIPSVFGTHCVGTNCPTKCN